MNVDWLNIVILIVGIFLTIFGARILFEKGFVEKLQEGIWKDKNDTWTKEEQYKYNKYVRGISYFGSGIIAMAYAVWMLFF